MLFASKSIKTYNVFILFFLATVLRGNAQNPDVAVSYILREVQIHLAKQYEKELKRSLVSFTHNFTLNTAFYYAPLLQSTPNPPSFINSNLTSPCNSKWGPLKRRRCVKKRDLLLEAERLVRKIPVVSTSYKPRNAVQTRMIVKANSILKDIDIMRNEY